MDYEVIIAPRAIEDLKDIVLYILPDRPEAATRLARALVERVKVLAHFPFSGRKVPEFDHPMIRELILRPYRIVYRVDEEKKQVGVARFWHGAQHSLAPDDI
jgi:toxin ParE1/3/4